MMITRLTLTGILTGVVVLFSTLGPLHPAHAQTDSPSPDDIAAMEARLNQYPVLYNLGTPAVHAIFARGQTLGMRPNVFTTVGDSNTTNGDFMRPLGRLPSNCDLGAFASLQAAIDYFSVSPREGQANSFLNDSIAAQEGFSTATVLDSAWADWKLCEADESPLQCEYRLVHPSVAVIMLGQIDINYGDLTADQYRANMETIIQTSIDEGVIPIVTTIVFLPQKDVYPLSLEYNMALLDLVDQYQVPLINIWSAVQDFPNHGIGPDNSHLSTKVGSYCKFNGPQLQYGNVQRNLLTLQALDTLRTTVLDAAP